MNKAFLFLTFIAFWVLPFGCKKIGPDDPWMSMRSRDKRAAGKWNVVRYFYENGKKSGVDNLGDPFYFYYELTSDGEFYDFDSSFNKKRKRGNWNWTPKSDGYESKEVIILGNQDFYWAWAEFHIIEELRNDKIRSRFQFDGDPKRYYIYEWTRHK